MSGNWGRAKQRKEQVISEDRPRRIWEDAEARVQIPIWNRDPIKHYVRRVGWEKIISNYIIKMRDSGVTRSWKYLTFPGLDALDIGLLYKKDLLDSAPNGRLSVAICDRDIADKVAMRLEKVGGILASSSLELHKALENPSNRLVKEFPYDVINLDFCNSLILPNRNNLLALDQIFNLQRGQAFLLLLTARPDPNQKDEHLEILKGNLKHEPGFLKAYEIKYASDDPSACLADYTAFTLIIFSKIVAGYAKEYRYRICEHFTARYHRPDGYDMVSHSFELDPILGRRKDIKKYEPRYPKERIERILNRELHQKVQQEAEKEYGIFLEALPIRLVSDINEILTKNPALVDDLAKEVRTLETWLN